MATKFVTLTIIVLSPRNHAGVLSTVDDIYFSNITAITDSNDTNPVNSVTEVALSVFRKADVRMSLRYLCNGCSDKRERQREAWVVMWV